MASFVYAKITTNRTTLKKYIETFRARKTSQETLIAPRPLPGRPQTSYYALVKLQPDSQMHSYFAEKGKLTVITGSQYEQETANIKYHWSA
jgi:hypothetical protein